MILRTQNLLVEALGLKARETQLNGFFAVGLVFLLALASASPVFPNQYFCH